MKNIAWQTTHPAVMHEHSVTRGISLMISRSFLPGRGRLFRNRGHRTYLRGPLQDFSRSSLSSHTQLLTSSLGRVRSRRRSRNRSESYSPSPPTPRTVLVKLALWRGEERIYIGSSLPFWPLVIFFSPNTSATLFIFLLLVDLFGVDSSSQGREKL